MTRANVPEASFVPVDGGIGCRRIEVAVNRTAVMAVKAGKLSDPAVAGERLSRRFSTGLNLPRFRSKAGR
jgi:hypothetical protein